MSVTLPIPQAVNLRMKLILLTASLTLIPEIGWSQEYLVTDMGTLGGSSSSAVAVNNAGQVVGTAAVAGNIHSDPFLYYQGSIKDAWAGGTEFGGTVPALNNKGQFVVNYNLDATGDTESYLWDGVNWVDLGIGGASGMNQSDTLVGNGPQGYWE